MKYAGLAELILWVGFLAYWILMGVRTRGSFSRKGAGVRLVIFLVYALLVRLAVVHQPAAGLQPTGVVRSVLGLGLTILGLAFAIWARVYLSSNWGMPMTERVGGSLTTTGPYRLVRHPIYTGMILGLVGTAVAVGWFLLLPTAILCTYFVFSALYEERYLVKIFGQEYETYKATTKMLVPYLL